MIGSKRLINSRDIKSPIVEAYKTLRTNIQFSMPDGGPKTILVTSGTPGEGKSTTSCNLAITMAQSNKRVLLLDGDLRKSVLHRIFGISNLQGLTNILTENADYRKVLKSDVMDNLDIITGGPTPPNPSELLASKRMKAFIESVKMEYDIIILDTPPILAVTDSAILSPLVDGVVLVVGHGQATFEDAAQAKALLERVNAKILGVILNRIPVSQTGGHYYYYEDDSSASRHSQPKKQAGAKAGA